MILLLVVVAKHRDQNDKILVPQHPLRRMGRVIQIKF